MKVLMVLAVALLSACTAPLPEPTTSAEGPDAPSPAVTDRMTPAPHASPSGMADAAEDFLECDGPVSDVGGSGEEVSLQVGGGATPQEALDAFLATSPWVVPRAGYEPIATAGDRHAFGFRADGEIKVVVVVSPRFADRIGAAFAADELRSCPSGEFGPDAEFADGRRSWTHVDTGHVITDIAGPAHCDWQTARLLHLEHPDGSLDRQYVRDPAGVLPDGPLLETYAENVELPEDAVDSGYRSPDGFELWFTDDDTALYVVTPDGIERWPRAREPIGCA